MVMILPIALTLAPTIGYDPDLGLTFLPIFLAMTLLAIPPILVATYAGLREVDRDLIEAGRGMGLRERQILGRIEVPLAVPIIVGGFRTATLQVIATATIGAILVVRRAGPVHRRRARQDLDDGHRSSPARSSSTALAIGRGRRARGGPATCSRPRALRGRPAPRAGPSDDRRGPHRSRDVRRPRPRTSPHR